MSHTRNLIQVHGKMLQTLDECFSHASFAMFAASHPLMPAKNGNFLILTSGYQQTMTIKSDFVNRSAFDFM